MRAVPLAGHLFSRSYAIIVPASGVGLQRKHVRRSGVAELLRHACLECLATEQMCLQLGIRLGNNNLEESDAMCTIIVIVLS